MTQLAIKDIMRAVRTLTPWDSVGKAAELLRTSPASALPVVWNGRVLGIVAEEDLAICLRDRDEDCPCPDRTRSASVQEVMREPAESLSGEMTLQQAADLFSRTDCPALPVVDGTDFYIGLLSRLDLLSYQCRSLRPAVIGGMATPLGVYLTTGTFGIGARSLGLFLAGSSLMLINCLALLLTQGCARLVELGLPQEAGRLGSGAFLYAKAPNLLAVMMDILPIAFFLILVRLSPLAGYHAAEHQVVHAIENGEPLVPEVVSRMPRVHPRCGTNFMAGLMVMMLVVTVIEPIRIPIQMSVVIATLVTMATWRPVGEMLQYYVTTRPASLKQLESGIRAGEALLERYRAQPGRRMTLRGRLWHSGILQVAAGFFVIYALMLFLVGPKYLAILFGPGF